MSKPCVMWESSVETYRAIGWCLSNHAKVSGRKCDGVLVTEGRAAPFGVLSPAVIAGMEVRAAGAAKTAPLVIKYITWLLLAGRRRQSMMPIVLCQPLRNASCYWQPILAETWYRSEARPLSGTICFSE